MAWLEVPAEEYARHFANPVACYLRADFNLLNAAKVDAVRFLAFAAETADVALGSNNAGASNSTDRSNKAGGSNNADFRIGIVVGERGDEWFSPYSAPFGGFACAKGVTIDEIDEAVAALPAYVSSARKNLGIVLAPAIYGRTFIAKCISSMFRAGFAMRYADLSYAFDFRDARPYEKRLWNMARRNLKLASRQNFEYRMETSPDGIAACYEVIRKNREFKGYPLKMSLEAFQKTSAVVPIEFSTLYLDGTPVAAAIVYRVAANVAQLIYWGDAPGFEESRPMNMLACKVYEHYSGLGLDVLDIGPSSEDGVPNVGLCAFKESVGCVADLKYAFAFDGRG